MGREKDPTFTSRLAPLLLLALLLAPGVAVAPPTDKWSVSLTTADGLAIPARIVDLDITSTGRAVVATGNGLVVFTDDAGKSIRSEGWATPAIRVTSDGLKAAVARSSNVAVIDNSGRNLWGAEKSIGGKATGLGMDRSAQLVAAGADDKYVYLFDGSGTSLGRAYAGEAPTGVAVAGDRVAVGLPSGKVLLLDRAGNTLWQADAGAPVNGVDISSTSVVAATASNSIVAFSLAGEKMWSASTGSPALALALPDDGSLVLVAAQAGDARLYNSKGEFQWPLKSEGDAYTAVSFSPDGSLAAVGSRGAIVKVMQTGVTVATPAPAPAQTPNATATPSPTPTPTATLSPSSTPAPSPTPAAASPSPTPATPAPKKSPGFEALLGIAALGVAVSLKKRQ